jgi:hypothetical protein
VAGPAPRLSHSGARLATLSHRIDRTIALALSDRDRTPFCTSNNMQNWKRIAGGKVSVLSESDMIALATAEGVSPRLISARVKKAKTVGHVKHGVGFASAIATYEAMRGGQDNAGISRRDGSWAVR